MDREKLLKEIGLIQDAIAECEMIDEKYLVYVDRLEQFWDILKEFDRLEMEKQSKVRELSNEEVKTKNEANEAELKLKEAKFESVMRTVQTVTGSVMMLTAVVLTLGAEETRPITSKAFQIATRLLPRG